MQTLTLLYIWTNLGWKLPGSCSADEPPLPGLPVEGRVQQPPGLRRQPGVLRGEGGQYEFIFLAN